MTQAHSTVTARIRIATHRRVMAHSARSRVARRKLHSGGGIGADDAVISPSGERHQHSAPSRGAAAGLEANQRVSDARLGHLFATYGDRLRRFAARVMKSRADADDVVQDAFWSLWRRRHELNVGDRASGLLFKATRASALDHVKRDFREAARQRQYLDTSATEVSAADAPTFDSQAIQRAFLEVVATMPPRQREVTLFCFGPERMNAQEIADRLSIAPSTVRVLLGRATKTLRANLPTLLDR